MTLGAGTAVLAVGVFLATTVCAQATAPRDTIAEARRLRDAGDFAGAATLLVPYAQNHPDDAGTARFAALMSYWSKDFRVARATYERALELHPDDTSLRLDAARFLVDVGEGARARDVLEPFSRADRTSPEFARAQTLLGTIAYWSGDYSGARTHFVDALRADSSDATARRQLREIAEASAAWVRVGVSGWRDDQPLRSTTFDAEGGWFPSPLTPLSVRAGSTQFSHDGATETVSRAEGTVATFIPRARMDLSAGGGVLNRTFGDASDWTARGSLGVRLPHHVVAEAKVERAPYLNTTSSLATAVMTRSLEGAFRWRSPRGWTGDAVARRETFEDDNAITTGYFWLLAPVLRRSTGHMQFGYSFAAQAARHSRFVPRADAVTFPPGQPPATVRGVYDPYYTPRDLRAHSALASATLRPGPRWSVTGNGTYGFHARDDAPVLVVVPRPPNVNIVRAYYRRELTPWNVRGAIEGSATDAVRFALEAEHGKGAYYAFTTVGVRLTYTFIAAARRRADRY